MNRFFGLMVAAMMTFCAVGAHAQAKLPKAGNSEAGFFHDDSLLGCKPFRVEQSTTPVLITSSPGFVEHFSVFGSTWGWAALFDNTSVSTQTTGIALLQVPVSGQGILNAVVAAILPGAPSGAAPATQQPSNIQGHMDMSEGPQQFASGLVVSLSTSGITGAGCYRLNAGPNP